MSNTRMVRVYAKSPQTYFQDGGANMQAQQQAPQINQEQLMQIIQMFAQITGNDPQQIAQQLQQLPPEQQMQAIQQMAQTVQQQQGQQGPEQQMQAQQAQPGMPPQAAEQMPEGEDAAMADMGGGEEMAPPMMYGGMTGYAKTNKKLLKKAAGGNSGANPTYNTEQEKIKERVGGAIGNNFVNNMIDKASERFMGRAQQPQTNFEPGGAFENPYLQSANAAYKSAMGDQRAGKSLFDERMETAGDTINPYVQMKGKAIGDEYNMFNRPRFTQRDYTPGASIENSMFQQRNGGDIQASMALYKNGGYTTIPVMGMFQNAGQADLEKAQEEQVKRLNTAHQNGTVSDEEYMNSMNKLDETYANYGKSTTSNQEEKETKDPGYVDLKWRGNLDKATENLYLRNADIKTGFFNRNNVRRANLTFGERGMGSDIGAIGAGIGAAAGAGQSSNSNISNNGTLLENPVNSNNQDTYRKTLKDRWAENQMRKSGYEFDDNNSQINNPEVQQTMAPNFTTPYGSGPTTVNPAYFQSLPGAPGGMSYNSNPVGAYNEQQQGTTPTQVADMLSQMRGFGSFSYGGSYLPMAIDGMEDGMSTEDKFQIKMKEKSGAAGEYAPLAMAKAQQWLGSINAARANTQKEDAYNVALNTESLPSDMPGSLGSFGNTTGPSTMMQNFQMGMLPGRAGFATPGQQTGYSFGGNDNRYRQDGGEPDLSQYEEGGDYWMTEDEVKQFMKMGGKVEYY